MLGEFKAVREVEPWGREVTRRLQGGEGEILPPASVLTQTRAQGGRRLEASLGEARGAHAGWGQTQR